MASEPELPFPVASEAFSASSASATQCVDVKPKDFFVLLGGWSYPTANDPTMTLIRADLVELWGKVTMAQRPISLMAGFEISKTDDQAGWEDTYDVEIGVKTGAMKRYLTHSIKSLISEMKPNEKLWVGMPPVTLDFTDDPNLQFAFISDDFSVEKRGMVFYGAKVLYS